MATGGGDFLFNATENAPAMISLNPLMWKRRPPNKTENISQELKDKQNMSLILLLSSVKNFIALIITKIKQHKST